VLDGHHRFWAYKSSGVKSIPVQVVPAKDVEEVGRQDVTEAADPRFMNFMNTSLGDRTDQPSKKIKTGQDWYDNTPTMNIDSGMVSYRPALDFCNKTLQKLKN
jgi:hypothetical protein